MGRVKEDYRSLTGPQKAAMFMLSLNEEHSAKLFAMLGDDEIKELSQIMASLGTVSSNLVERVFVEFADALSSTGSLTGSFDTTERLLRLAAWRCLRPGSDLESPRHRRHPSAAGGWPAFRLRPGTGTVRPGRQPRLRRRLEAVLP